MQKVKEPPLRDCPHCGKPELVKLVSAAGFRLAGAGWYETDFKTGDKRNLASAPDEKSPGGKKDGAKDKAGDGKQAGGKQASGATAAGAAKPASGKPSSGAASSNKPSSGKPSSGGGA